MQEENEKCPQSEMVSEISTSTNSYQLSLKCHVFNFEHQPGEKVALNTLASMVGFYLINKGYVRFVDTRHSPSEDKVISKWVLDIEHK